MSLQEETDIPSPSPVLSRPSREKTRRPPTVTPKRFNRFFNPASSRGSSGESKGSRILRSLTASAANARALSSQHAVEDDFPFARSAKRRKHTPLEDSDDDDEEVHVFDDVSFQSSPLKSSPCQRSSARKHSTRVFYPQPIVRASGTGYASAFSPDLWQSHTADFFSTPDYCRQFEQVPYCTAACNTNSLIAIGDEGGALHIVDTAADRRFDKSLFTLRPHANAIMDATFSPDDHLLATVAGDKLGRIIDIQTQAVLYTLWAPHVSNPKQIVFAPDSSSTLATCGRDGSVHLWDVRSPPNLSAATSRNACNDLRGELVKPVKSLQAAPTCPSTVRPTRSSTTSGLPGPHAYSVTSVRFFPNRPNLFVTSSAASSRLLVWDIRSRLSPHNSTPAAPVSISGPPPDNASGRDYGTSDLCFTPSGSQLFAVSKDRTVHAYSAPHLILGQDPPDAHRPKQNQTGVLPRHRLWNPDLRVETFYIRASVRRAADDRPELLAVGNSRGAPILFPTDERLVRSHRSRPSREDERTVRDGGEVPLVDVGTRLARGHGREVSSVAWSCDGDLVSASDDKSVRVWREDRERARGLRACGEVGGERWGCGWAEGRTEWDDGGEDEG